LRARATPVALGVFARAFTIDQRRVF